MHSAFANNGKVGEIKHQLSFMFQICYFKKNLYNVHMHLKG
jgi:hypothetical protein